MSAIPYMPFYIADYLADAAHLSTLEHGAYLLLIMNYWQTGKPLPNDDKKLSRIVHLPLSKFSKLKPTLSEFFSLTDSEWRHSRIESELAIFKEKSDKARLAAHIGVKKREEKKSANAELPLSESSTNAERMPSHTDVDVNTDKDKNKDTALKHTQDFPKTDPPPNAEDLPEPLRFEDFWKVYPRDEEKKSAKAAWQKQKLDCLANTIIADVEQRKLNHEPWIKEGGQYIPYAVRYLRKERWKEKIQLIREVKSEIQKRNKPKSKTEMLYDNCPSAFIGTAFDTGEPEYKIINPET